MRHLIRVLLAAAVLLPLAFAGAADAQVCSRRMGPYVSYDAAFRAAQQARAYGYRTSGIWGEGGVVSQWSNRRYFFNVFLPC
jgi:hypothetical protein